MKRPRPDERWSIAREPARPRAMSRSILIATAFLSFVASSPAAAAPRQSAAGGSRWSRLPCPERRRKGRGDNAERARIFRRRLLALRPARIRQAQDTVTFDYEVKLLTGVVVDSSYTAGQPLTGKAGDFVPGFSEALELMRPGDEWIVWVPPQLGYGQKNMGPIPGNSVLRFRLALHKIAPRIDPVPPPRSAGILLFRKNGESRCCWSNPEAHSGETRERAPG